LTSLGKKRLLYVAVLKAFFGLLWRDALKKGPPPHTHAIGPIVEKKKDPAEISTYDNNKDAGLISKTF